MRMNAILGDDEQARDAALAASAGAPEHERSALTGKLAPIARELAAAVTAAERAGSSSPVESTAFARACRALSILGVEAAKSCLLRIADEGSSGVKRELARALRATTTAAGRAVLVHLLADDDARGEAILAIAVAPWPEVLPILIEISEADDHSARLAAEGIAKCGATAGPNERYAATDFLIEQLDDDAILSAAFDALLRFGASFPGVAERARRLAREPGERAIMGLCLLVACCPEGGPSLADILASAAPVDPPTARSLLGRLRQDPDERVRQVAERTSTLLEAR